MSLITAAHRPPQLQIVAALAVGAGRASAQNDRRPTPAVPQFTGWISGSNTIFHWVKATDQGGGTIAHCGLYRDGKLLKTVSAGTSEAAP